MSAFIPPPQHIPWPLRAGMWFARRVTGKDLLPARLLAWYPKAAVSSGVLEALIAHDEGRVDARMLKLVRMGVSFQAGCAFCMDMNSTGWERLLTPQELSALQGRLELEAVPSFSERERLAVQYARLATQTPLVFPAQFMDALRAQFNEREIVILATTAAQVNYWTRLIQALGCPPAGFNDDLSLFLPVRHNPQTSSPSLGSPDAPDAIEAYTVSLLYCGAQYLLLQRSLAKQFAPGRWTGLGGRVEAEEYAALRAAALREVQEEAGLPPAEIHEFVLRRALLVNRPHQPLRVLLYYTGRLDQPVLPACPEGSLAWKAAAEFAGLDVIETTRPVLDCLVEDAAQDPAGARPPVIGMAYFGADRVFQGVSWGGEE